jgi:hypothetical protein
MEIVEYTADKAMEVIELFQGSAHEAGNHLT